MRWFESQIESRSRFDAEINERAYAQLAASVSGSRHALGLSVDDVEQADSAVRVCLKALGVEPGQVPQSITDIDERISWMCRPTGTMRRSVRLDKDWYKQALGVMVGRLDTGELVPLVPYTMYGYCYVAPGTNRKVRITKAVAEHIDEEALLFYKPLPAKPLEIKDIIAFISRVFDRNDYIAVFAAALAVTLIGLVPPWANQVAFGVVAPSSSAELILPIGALLLGAAISTALITAFRNLVMTRVSTKLNTVTQAAAFSRLLALPTSFFKQYSSGNLASRLLTVTMLVNLMASVVLGAGLSALLSLVYIGQIGAFAPSLAVPALIIVVVQAVLTIVVTFLTVRYEQAMMEASASLSGTVTALLNGVQKIKLAGAEDRAFAKWAKGYAQYAQAAYNRPTVMRALPALVALIGFVGTIAIYYLAGTSHVSVADYMAFNVAYGQVTAAIMALAGMAGQIAQAGPMFDMVKPILEATPETAEDKPSVESLSGAIEVSGVSFRYSESQPYVLEDLSFKVKPGEYVGIVGESGCGKSTIMRLLLGFETPEQGAIFYGPYDAQKVDLRSLRQHVGVVMQDGSLFMGDIYSNIVISNPMATIDEAWDAAELAGIADDIRKMPMGMHTFVTEGGGGVSGGQRQRLMIARAVCGKRRILMFDEATSALDNKTQKHVSNSLDALNCTRIVIAHRLSTVRHCDRILVVAGGKIAEEGTYDELLAKDGLFAGLVERQRLDKEG